jgi:colicin import membrane protein
VSITLSVLLHGALLAALVYGWLLFRQPPRPAPTLAIEAKVIEAHATPRAPTPAPQPAPAAAPQAEPPPEAVGPPQPTAEELAQREQERQQAEAAATEERRAAEEKAAAEQAAKAAEEQRQAEARAQAERKEQERQQRLAEAEEKSEREAAVADLKRSLATEQTDAGRAGPALANWESMIAAKITRAWLRPPTARPGIECMLYVTQVPGGEVTQVRIGQCNGDQAVRESIEAAVYRASPLPPPPDPALFDRNLKIDFKPD